MNYAALIPFATLFVCFVGIRLSLTYSAFVSLLITSLLTQTTFHATPEIWNESLIRTLEITVEIGLILVGAFFFIETAHETHVIDSLARLVKRISPSKIVQGLLVSFPVTLMVEGSSGFGTPLLIISPLLLALDFPVLLCAILPFVNFPIGIPYGALGTPIRLSFLNPTLVSQDTFLLLAPFALLSPILTYLLIERFQKTEKTTDSNNVGRSLIWVMILALTYFTVSLFISRMGPEFPALAGGFFTFILGLFSAPYFFKGTQEPVISILKSERRGIVTYALLLLTLWIGKQIFLEQLIPGTHIRLFNPGLIFIGFATALHFFFHEGEYLDLVRAAATRSKRTLIFFFCMTFLVQQLQKSGALENLIHSLPNFLIGDEVSILGWLGSIFIGTSTVTNLLFAPVIDPARHAALAAGSAIGVQLAFQAVIAMHSILQPRNSNEIRSSESMSELKILAYLFPLSLGFLGLVVLFYKSRLQFG